MTSTITITQPVRDNQRTTATLSTPDLETRLALASAGMDAILAHRHGDVLDEAQAAVQDAVAEASLTETLPVDPAFQPNPVLAKAGRIVARRGWTKGTYSSEKGEVCAMGAIREAIYGPRWNMGVTDAREEGPISVLLDRIAADLGCRMGIPGWNDSRESAADVLRLLY